jgi:hypothetical protein
MYAHCAPKVGDIGLSVAELPSTYADLNPNCQGEI